MSDCEGCHWHEYDPETGEDICHCREELNYEVCQFYSQEDAKADAKYGREDRY